MEQQDDRIQALEEKTLTLEQKNQEIESNLETLVTGLESLKSDLKQDVSNTSVNDDVDSGQHEDTEIVEEFVQSIEAGDPSHPELFQRILDDVETKLYEDNKVIIDASYIVEEDEWNAENIKAAKLMVDTEPFEGCYWVESLGKYAYLEVI